ncbi:MAG: hypothetical protein HFF12_10875 [Angelakisella sp.]|nr:hypothetical protein [Angelakisella sp.]
MAVVSVISGYLPSLQVFFAPIVPDCRQGCKYKPEVGVAKHAFYATLGCRLLFLLAKEEKEAKRRMTKDFNNTANLIGKSAWFGRSPEVCTSIRSTIPWIPEEAGVLDF